MQEQEQVSALVDLEDIAILDAIAKSDDRTRADIIRYAIKDYLKAHKGK